jgi:hypothetical protein
VNSLTILFSFGGVFEMEAMTLHETMNAASADSEMIEKRLAARMGTPNYINPE